MLLLGITITHCIEHAWEKHQGKTPWLGFFWLLPWTPFAEVLVELLGGIWWRWESYATGWAPRPPGHCWCCPSARLWRATLFPSPKETIKRSLPFAPCLLTTKKGCRKVQWENPNVSFPSMLRLPSPVVSRDSSSNAKRWEQLGLSWLAWCIQHRDLDLQTCS